MNIHNAEYEQASQLFFIQQLRIQFAKFPLLRRYIIIAMAVNIRHKMI